MGGGAAYTSLCNESGGGNMHTRGRRYAAWLLLVGGTCVLLLAGCTALWTPQDAQIGEMSPMAKRVIWRVPGDFATIQEAIDSLDVDDGHRILVGSGSHAGALVDKAVEIRGEGGAVIDSGPVHGSGLIQGFRLKEGSDGASITHLTFAVDLAIMNGNAVHSVTVSHCTFINPIQAVSNWSGCDWEISHNLVEDLRCLDGGGIGIFIGDWTGGLVSGNVVSYNTIRGVLTVWPNDCGGYNGSGIVIYADFRGSRAGAEEISGNRVVHNTISLASDTPDVVDVVAFELTDTRDDLEEDLVIFDNAIGFNDFRGTELQIALTPEELLADYNDISRNLGDNRGHGTHPSVFGPGEP